MSLARFDQSLEKYAISGEDQMKQVVASLEIYVSIETINVNRLASIKCSYHFVEHSHFRMVDPY